MKHLVIFIPLIIAILSCSPRNKLDPPDNPLDPNNPMYESPSAAFIDGPNEGDIISTTSVTFDWQGNETALEYSYKLDSFDWSLWSNNTSTTFARLDEGQHRVQVRAKGLNLDDNSTPIELNFEVNAVSGMSAIVYPYRQYGLPGDTLIYQVIAEEVSDVFAIQCKMSINTDYLELIETGNGSIVDEWGGELLSVLEIDTTTISLAIVSVEEMNPTFSGTTSILTLRVRVKPTINITSEIVVVEILDVIYINTNSEVLNINGYRSGILEGVLDY